MEVCEDGSFWFAKQCQWKLMRERSEWSDPHRLLGLNFYLIRVVTIWPCGGGLIIRFDDSVDYSSYMDCVPWIWMFDVKGLSCALFLVTLVPTANMEALRMIHYGSIHFYVYGSNKADLNLKESKSHQRGSFPSAFHPNPWMQEGLNQRARHWWRSFTLSGFDNMTVYV